MHFANDLVKTNISGKRYLAREAIPVIYLKHVHNSTTVSSIIDQIQCDDIENNIHDVSSSLEFSPLDLSISSKHEKSFTIDLEKGIPKSQYII